MKKQLFILLSTLFLISSCKIHTYYQSEYLEQYSKIITYKCAFCNTAIESLDNLSENDNKYATFTFLDDDVVYLKLHLFTWKEDENGNETRVKKRYVEDLYLNFTSNNPVRYFIRGEPSETTVYQTEQMIGCSQEYNGTFDFRRRGKAQEFKTIFIRFECPKDTVLKVDYASVE